MTRHYLLILTDPISHLFCFFPSVLSPLLCLQVRAATLFFPAIRHHHVIFVIHDDLFTSSSDLSDERLLRLRKSFVLENLLQFGQTHGRDLLRGDGQIVFRSKLLVLALSASASWLRLQGNSWGGRGEGGRGRVMRDGRTDRATRRGCSRVAIIRNEFAVESEPEQ